MSGFQLAVSYESCMEKGSQNASDVTVLMSLLVQ